MFYGLIQECVGVGSKEQLRIIYGYKYQDDIQETFRLMLDPSHVFNTTKIPDAHDRYPHVGPTNYRLGYMNSTLNSLLQKNLKGEAGSSYLQRLYDESSLHLRKVLTWVIARKNPARVGVSIVNKVWPGLIRVQEYMGAVPGTQEALERLFSDTETVSVQEKVDGMACLVQYHQGVPVGLRSRQGKDLTDCFPIFLSRCAQVTRFTGNVHHELFVGDELGRHMDRAKGNGLINSVVSSGVNNQDIDEALLSVLLDYYSSTPQEVRYSNLADFETHYSARVPQYDVRAIEEAREIARNIILRGGEGVVCKHPDKPFQNGKPWFNVKIKHEFEVELICTGVNPSTKSKNLIGSLRMETYEGDLVVNVGSGFTDNLRLSDPEYLLGLIFSVRANEVIRLKAKKKASLYLPRVMLEGENLCIRWDKDRADTYQEVLAQESASKFLG